MVIWVEAKEGARGVGERVVGALRELGFPAALAGRDGNSRPVDAVPIDLGGSSGGTTHTEVIEQILRRVPVDFESLPLLVEGDSKQVRLWTPHVALMRFKPTVYSFTMNRYGEAPGTDAIRLRFTAALMRRMARLPDDGGARPESAFLAEIQTERGPLLAERRVDPGNLEIRIKRYHIGSPVHRYRFTERHPSTQSSGPLVRWARLDRPVVCFDWRHPLRDDDGNRLADEPLSDDYAGAWMVDVGHAKEMARRTFLWMEGWFEGAGLRLVDMCLFVDRSGRTIFGEISPDCMRVRLDLGDPAGAESADKDLWRSGRAPEVLLRRYQQLYSRLFGNIEEES